jgi:putative phage-type endonuclease
MTFYMLKDLEQGTEDWRNWRRKVIGASEAPTIMNQNPWQSVNHLMNEKLGRTREFQGNAATREGHALEIFARKELQKKFGLKIKPAVAQDSDIPYLAASLDGIDTSHSIIFEIKSGKKAYEYLAAKKEIPIYYFAQLQHQMMVTKMSSVVYAAYRPDLPMIVLEVKRNKSFITEMREKELLFMQTLRRQGHIFQEDFVGKLTNKK